jgi:hypothetical protein
MTPSIPRPFKYLPQGLCENLFLHGVMENRILIDFLEPEGDALLAPLSTIAVQRTDAVCGPSAKEGICHVLPL